MASPTLINVLRKASQVEAIVDYVVVYKRCRLYSGVGQKNPAGALRREWATSCEGAPPFVLSPLFFSARPAVRVFVGTGFR